MERFPSSKCTDGHFLFTKVYKAGKALHTGRFEGALKKKDYHAPKMVYPLIWQIIEMQPDALKMPS